MKTLGLVVGIGPESTVAYYRALIARFRARAGGNRNPSLVMVNVDLGVMLGHFDRKEFHKGAQYLGAAIQRLADAGSTTALLTSNTPHLIFDELQAASPIPLISIVETVRDEAVRLKMKRLAVLGTRYTMEGGFYAQSFAKVHRDIVLPSPEERALIHTLYMDELVPGVFRPETRERFLGIIARMQRDDGIDGVILGGTELPLLLPEGTSTPVPLLDTLSLHVERGVLALLQP